MIGKNSSFYLFLKNSYTCFNIILRKVFLLFNAIILFIPNIIFRIKGNYLLVRNFTSIGDNLIWTPVLENFPKDKKIILVHQSPEIFKNINCKKIYFKKSFFGNLIVKFLIESPHSNIIGRVINPAKLNKFKLKKYHLRDLATVNWKSFHKICREIPKKNIIKFDKNEINEFQKKYSNLKHKKIGLIISDNNYSGLSDKKRWGPKNFQKVVDETNNQVDWIQVGINKDAELENTFLDLRGRTNLRELFYLCSISEVIVTTEGMLTHASSAFETPCVTIFPCFIYPELSMYSNIIPLVPEKGFSCQYCSGKEKVKQGQVSKCNASIIPEKVVKTIKKLINER